MKKGSLTIMGVLLAVGFAVNLQQGGRATTATILGYAPLGLYLLALGLSWLAIAWSNRKR